MGRERGSLAVLCLSLLLLLEGAVMSSSHGDNKSCHPSRCGIITNISYPFRLRDDPPHCGHRSYELGCENNVTILPLPDYNDIDYYELHNRTYRMGGRYPLVGRYRVLGINYNNFTIRLVDEGIHKGNCSSLPLYSFPLPDFNYYSYPYSATTAKSVGAEVGWSILINPVAYLKCSDPVREEAAYVDTSPCVNRESEGRGGHLYAVAGYLPAQQFQPQCRLISVTPIATDWETMVPRGRNKSYADIHTVLSSGFELSWFYQACADLNCSGSSYCVYSPKTQGPQCPIQIQRICYTPMGMEVNCSISRLPRLRVFAEDYLHGVLKGLNRIVNMYIDDFPLYDSRPSKLLIKLGAFTGRFIFPFIAIRLLFGVVLLSTLLIYTCRRRHLSIYEDIENFIRLHDLIPIRYSYKDLKTMTEGFKNKLGQGGFGTVYKGKLRSGPNVAIKMLGKCNKANGQEFMSEVATIGRIHHFNVVHLVGFCVEGTKRALVYEFMSRGSLDKYIFHKEEDASLSYRKIYEISLGVAHGIAYLHHGCDMQILHFDIKPHNILLDDNFTPKISDFGLARLYAVDDSIATLTGARGTIGYMAPELFYKNIGRVSYKADVYSFGMLLMEMTSQRRNVNPHAENSSQLYFPLWIYDQFDDKKDIEMEDLMEEEKDLVKKMFIVALWCIQLKPTDRPSMNKVIEMLEANDMDSLEMPPKPSLYPNETVVVDAISSSDEAISTVLLHSHNCLGEGTSNGN